MTDLAGEGSVARARDEFFHEHRKIQDSTRQIESVRDLHELLRCLQRARTLLEHHFVSEEAPGGFFDTVRSAAPRFSPRVEKLGEDHRAFLSELDQLAERARACLAGPVAEVLKQAADLARRLREHEAHEGEILIDALYDETGEEE